MSNPLSRSVSIASWPLFLEIVTQLSDFWFIYDREGKHIALRPPSPIFESEETEDWLGQTPEAILQQPISSAVSTWLHQVQKVMRMVLIDRQKRVVIHQVAQGSTLHCYETTYQWFALPHTFDVLLCAGRIVTDSRVLYQQQLAEYQTLQQQLQEQRRLLQQIIDHIPQYIFWKDFHSVYQGGNRVFTTSIGLSSPDDLIGLTDYDIAAFSREDADYFRQCDRRVMDFNEPEIRAVEAQPNSEGEPRWVERTKLPLHNNHGQVNGILGILNDVTSREHMEVLAKSEAQIRAQAEQLERSLRELQQTQSKLIQTEKMSSLGQLVAGIAHEINNPLNFIVGNLTFIDRYVQSLATLTQIYQTHLPEASPALEKQLQAVNIDLDFILEDLPKVLDSIRTGANRIHHIVRSLRNFSHLDESTRKKVDLHEGIDNTLLLLQHRLRLKSGHCEIQIVKQYCPLPKVDCCPSQINQVFMNILNNAIDALEEQRNRLAGNANDREVLYEPTIQIQTRLLEGQWVEVSFHDNGTGMSQEVRDRVFDPFFTTKPVGKGNGLGLSISYQIIVRDHRGQLQCISDPGQGTEILIQLPVQ